MIRDLIIEICARKSILAQLLKIENANLAQKSEINAFVAICSRYFKLAQCGAVLRYLDHIKINSLHSLQIFFTCWTAFIKNH